MKIAFYAPMKPPDHPNPSGDRQIARLLIGALSEMGHEVSLASRLRSWQKSPDPQAFSAQRQAGLAEAARIAADPTPPDLFLTYHVYHKAPDFIGPAVAPALDIPHVIIEASHAEDRREGPWRPGLEAAEDAIRKADAVVAFHSKDRAGLSSLVGEERLHDLRPFINASPFLDVPRAGPSSPVRLLTVGMMREGDKEKSYRVLADALGQIADRDWTLTIVGDGPARPQLEPLYPASRTRFLGTQPPEALPGIYKDADLFVWPAWREAFGLVFLEAMAAGLPVVGGRSGGVPEIVVDGETGLLAAPDDPLAQAGAISALIDQPAKMRAMGVAARRNVRNRHDMPVANTHLERILKAAKEHHMRVAV